jgi:hypothetical protein
MAPTDDTENGLASRPGVLKHGLEFLRRGLRQRGRVYMSYDALLIDTPDAFNQMLVHFEREDHV